MASRPLDPREPPVQSIFEPRRTQHAAEAAVRPYNPRTQYVIADRAGNHRDAGGVREATVEDSRGVEKVGPCNPCERLRDVKILGESDATEAAVYRERELDCGTAIRGH